MHWLTQDMRISRAPRRSHGVRRKSDRVRSLWRAGLDTSRIAYILSLTEAEVVRQLQLTKEMKRGNA
jgi:hypothetical protein